jgi:hypothetical protein
VKHKIGHSAEFDAALNAWERIVGKTFVTTSPAILESAQIATYPTEEKVVSHPRTR